MMKKIQSILDQLNKMFDHLMLEERHADFSCHHKWERRMLSCQHMGYYCSRCGKETLP